MKRVLYDPAPDLALDRLWERDDVIADAVEEAIDWIRLGDPRAKRRAFSSGLFLIEVRVHGEDWSILWEDDHDDDSATVRHIAETGSI